jgi:hypothetical protein
MIWALLALLGVPIWLIVGALAGVVWSRRHFLAQPGVFPVAIRAAGDQSWPRTLSYGRLIRDVLVVNRGPALVRTEIHPIVSVEPTHASAVPKKLDDAATRLLGIDGHADIEVAVPPRVAQQLDALQPSTAPLNG